MKKVITEVILAIKAGKYTSISISLLNGTSEANNVPPKGAEKIADVQEEQPIVTARDKSSLFKLNLLPIVYANPPPIKNAGPSLPPGIPDPKLIPEEKNLV